VKIQHKSSHSVHSNSLIRLSDNEPVHQCCNNYTNSKYVTVSLTAEDAGSGLDIMSFSTDNEIWTRWEPFCNERHLGIPSGDGKKTLFFQVQDRLGNIAKIVSDSIILDTTPPTKLSIIINNGSYQTKNAYVDLKLDAIDQTSGLYQMKFSTDGTTWSYWELFNTRYSIPLPTEDGDGNKIIYFKVKDHAGNIGKPVYSTILLITDMDADDMPDSWEISNGLNPNVNDANDDFDKDGLTNIEEYDKGTDPRFWDTDDDGLSDGDEIKKYHTNPFNPDSDFDGHLDGSDAYPSDPSKWKEEREDIDLFWIWILVITIVISFLISVLFIIKLRKKRREQNILQRAVTIKPWHRFDPLLNLLRSKKPYSEKADESKVSINKKNIILSKSPLLPPRKVPTKAKTITREE